MTIDSFLLKGQKGERGYTGIPGVTGSQGQKGSKGKSRDRDQDSLISVACNNVTKNDILINLSNIFLPNSFKNGINSSIEICVKMLQKIQCMHVHTRMGCSEVKAKYNQYLKISTFMWHKANRYQFFIWMSKFKGSKLKKKLIYLNLLC